MTDSDSIEEKLICNNCIGESHLSLIVINTGKKNICSYCDKKSKTIELEELCDRIKEAFSQHYRRTPDEPNSYEYAMHKDSDFSYNWYRNGESTIDTIMEAARISIKIAEDVQEILSGRHGDFESEQMGEECEFDIDAHYEEIAPDDTLWQEEWLEFEKSLKHEARYFNQVGIQHLKNIFSGINKLSTISGKSPIITVGPECEFSEIYRARFFQSGDKLCEALERPDLKMANPPTSLATASRMNANGISVFYGANEPQTAIAEIRPPVGSRVLVTKFFFLKELRLLDLTTLELVFGSGSIFDEKYSSRLEHLSFLRTLSAKMTRPVMPDDETLEYLPTQAIADFLSSENDPNLDGILYPSSQAGSTGRNIVLFQHAAKVAKIEVPKDTLIEAQTGMMTEEGWEIDYSVVETVKEMDKLNTLIEKENGILDSNLKLSTLKVDLNSMSIHHVNGVQYECSKHEVNRVDLK